VATLKYLKNRLRNSMTNENLESFMLMAIENKILMEIDNNIIINAVGEKSKLLSKLLLGINVYLSYFIIINNLL